MPVVPLIGFYLNGTPSLGNVYFRPSSNFTGTVSIPYSVYSANNQILCTGTIVIYVTP